MVFLTEGSIRLLAVFIALNRAPIRKTEARKYDSSSPASEPRIVPFAASVLSQSRLMRWICFVFECAAALDCLGIGNPSY